MNLIPVVLLSGSLVATGGGVLLAAGPGGEDRDPAPPAATKDAPGVISLARPVAPYRIGRVAVEMRITDPNGGRPRLVTHTRRTRHWQGRVQRVVCFGASTEASIRRHGGGAGSCTTDAGQVWSLMWSSGGRLVTFGGRASPKVKRLTVAGPGGTFVVPRSRHSGFLITYGRRAEGRMVLTATLADGSTRFFRSQVPPTWRPEGAVVATDPGGQPDWHALARLRTDRARRGQTCLQVQQEHDPRARSGQRGGAFVAPVCGDLARAPVVARTARLRGRTIVAGAARADVTRVSLVTPGGRRELPLADAGRAFLAVLSGGTTPSQLVLEATLADGTTLRYRNPVTVNRATTEHPPPRLVGKVSLRETPPGSRRVAVSLRLSAVATKRVEVTLLGRDVRLRHLGQRRYAGVYDGTRGRRRPIVVGRVYRMSLVTCGDTCSSELQRARMR